MQSEIRVRIGRRPRIEEACQMLSHPGSGKARFQHAHHRQILACRKVLDVLRHKCSALANRDCGHFAVRTDIDAAIAHMHRIVTALSQQFARPRRKHLVDEESHPPDSSAGHEIGAAFG
jgi:hypothetical protein